MKLDILAKNIELDNPLRAFVDEKMSDLGRLVGSNNFDARIEIGKTSKHHRSGPFFYAEVNLHVDGQLLRAQAEHEDLRAAIVDVKEELKVQIKKFKEKKKSSRRNKE